MSTITVILKHNEGSLYPLGTVIWRIGSACGRNSINQFTLRALRSRRKLILDATHRKSEILVVGFPV